VTTTDKFQLALFISGASPNSARAVNNIKVVCEEHLNGNYSLEVIDVHQRPEVAEQEQIIALPTLIKRAPGLERRLVGDLSDKARVLRGLGISI
jgi:circadian clock protein KaiB